MTKAKVFMDGFMNMLRADDFAKDNQQDRGSEINAEFITEQITSYVNLLNSGIIEKDTCMK